MPLPRIESPEPGPKRIVTEYLDGVAVREVEVLDTEDLTAGQGAEP